MTLAFRVPSPSTSRSPLTRKDFVAWLRREGEGRYHDSHPFHVRMHEGALSREELQRWVANRYYYQTRIPIKDAFIVAKSEDPRFRRAWTRRITHHDGDDSSEGGIVLWEKLGDAVGLPREELRAHTHVLPGVRFACDGYVNFVHSSSLVEAVASSLTECFAPDLMTTRIAAWEKHYRWIDSEALTYFRRRVSRAREEADEALAFVVEQSASSFEKQAACVGALVFKTNVLWHMLDCIDARVLGPGHLEGASPP